MEELASNLQLWSGRVVHSRSFVRAVNGAALVLLTAGMAHWTWAFVRPPQTPAQITANVAPSANSMTRTDLDRLLNIELFGRSATQAAPDKEIPVSSLNLLLMGVVAAGGESLALISVDGREQLPYAIGEEIAHGAILDEVRADSVIILRQGVRESLKLQDLTPSLPLSSFIPDNGTTASNGTDVTRINDTLYRVSKSALQMQMASPKLLSQALIVPHAGGGFEVRNVQNDSLYAKAGIQTGDIIRTVNGRQINSLDDVMQMYQETGGLDQLSSVNIDIERNGASQRLHYQLR